MESPGQQAAWLTAVLAGLFSFASPCILPLIPGYLSVLSGLSVEQLQEKRGRYLLRIFVSCLLFGAGVSAVFVVVGLSASALGQWLTGYRTVINIVLGAVVIFFGFFVLNLVKAPFLYRERRVHFERAAVGLWGAPLLGMAFGFGWTPCLGPFVGALITIAFNQPPAQGALLFAICGATLTACLVAAGLLFSYALRTFSFLQRHHRTIEVASGALLILIGVLLVTQQWDRASSLLMRVLS